MSTELKNTAANHEKTATKEQQQKSDEVRSGLGPLPEKLSCYCSDAIIARFLQVNNWNVRKGTKMLRECLKWRSEYKPDEILWVENVDSFVSDLARVYSGELTLVDECGDLLYKTHASQVAQLQLFISTVKFSRLNFLCIWKSDDMYFRALDGYVLLFMKE